MSESDRTTEDRATRGARIRAEVLGAAHVARASATAGTAGADLQRFITEWCWGEIWGRPGLDRRSRSLLNLGMLAASGKAEELKLHLRGALANGLTRDEITEVNLQVAVYCGAPAALEFQRAWRAVLAEIDG